MWQQRRFSLEGLLPQALTIKIMAAAKKRRSGRSVQDIIALIEADFEDPREAFFAHLGREEYHKLYGGEPEQIFSSKVLGGTDGKFRPGETEKLAEYFAEHEEPETVELTEFLAGGPPDIGSEGDPEAPLRVSSAKVDIIRAGLSSILQHGLPPIETVQAAHELVAGIEADIPIRTVEHVQTTGEIDDHIELLYEFLGPGESSSDEASTDDEDFIVEDDE